MQNEKQSIKTKKVILKYHNYKMLMTLDFSMLVEILIKVLGEHFILEFVPMSESERERSSVPMEGSGYSFFAVQERFYLMIEDENLEPVRRQDLEKRIVDFGQK